GRERSQAPGAVLRRGAPGPVRRRRPRGQVARLPRGQGVSAAARRADPEAEFAETRGPGLPDARGRGRPAARNFARRDARQPLRTRTHPRARGAGADAEPRDLAAEATDGEALARRGDARGAAAGTDLRVARLAGVRRVRARDRGSELRRAGHRPFPRDGVRGPLQADQEGGHGDGAVAGGRRDGIPRRAPQYGATARQGPSRRARAAGRAAPAHARGRGAARAARGKAQGPRCRPQRAPARAIITGSLLIATFRKHYVETEA